MEKQIKRELIYDGKIIKVFKDEVILEDQSKALREVVSNNGGACVAIKKNGKYLMVKQYRYAQAEDSLEFVAGKIEITDSPLETIIKEAKEEVGYELENIKDLGVIYPSPAFLSERLYLFSADASKYVGVKRDQGEFLEVYEYSLNELQDLVSKGLIRDAKTVVLIYKLLNLAN